MTTDAWATGAPRYVTLPAREPTDAVAGSDAPAAGSAVREPATRATTAAPTASVNFLDMGAPVRLWGSREGATHDPAPRASTSPGCPRFTGRKIATVDTSRPY